MNRGQDAVHPSSLALERLLAGQGTPELTAHLLTCETCRGHLAAMEASAKKFSASPHSLRAKDAALRADRKWKQRAAAFTVLSVAAVVLISLGAPLIIKAQPPEPTPPIATRPTPSLKRQAREVLEPRPETWSSRLRRVPMRGRDIDFGQGSLEAASLDGPPRPFTLIHTRVDVRVTGFMQGVSVTQTFKNPFATPVEAVYVFPLPDDSAVHDMTLKAGTRVIKSQIQKREVARAQYEQAKAEGRRAALLDQERPNIFTQSIANLLPGETVEVTLEYVAPLAYDDGVYTLNFPMVVGPRYVPGAALPGESEGRGTVPDTDRVTDASRITPPTSRGGRDIEVFVHLDAGSVIEDLWSASHRLSISRLASSRVELELDPMDTLPNKDLIVRWRVSGAEARASMLAAGGAFALMLNPEATSAQQAPTPKEMVFLIDTSCSMSGPPLDAAKRAMTSALQQMNPEDTFMLIDFADRASSFHATPLSASGENVRKAVSYLGALPAGGGTNQLEGIRAALSRAEDPSRVRMVLLMTDGFIGNEEEILGEVRKLRGGARVFGFGIGSSVNHYLLSRLSSEGRGFYQYVRTDEDSTGAVDRFVRRVRRPLITDVTVEWGGLPVADVMPEPIADLFDAQPLIIQGRYRAAASGTVLLKGRRSGKPVVFEVPVTLPDPSSEGRALSMAWARRRVEALSTRDYGSPTADTIREITSLALEYHLVSKYTSLVAVEQTPVTTPSGVTVTEPTLTADQTAEGGEVISTQKRFNTIQIIRGAAAAEPVDASGLAGRGKGGSRGYAVGTIDGLGASGHGVGGGGLGTLGTSGGGMLGVKGGAGDDFDQAFGGGRKAKVPEAKPDPAAMKKPAEPAEDYDETFGAGPGKPPEKAEKPPRQNYIPPAPGSASVVKDRVEASDIMEGVLRKKSELAACARLREPGTTGKIIIRWVIQPNGVPMLVSVDSASSDLIGTKMAACFVEVVKSMVFPKSKVLSDPVLFPFKY